MSDSHQAGSAGDETLADRVFRKFKEYGMRTWTDEHFVKVQDLPASGFNKFVFKNGNEERPDGFLSYSATGTVKVINMLNYENVLKNKTKKNALINLFLGPGRCLVCTLWAGGRLYFAEEPAH